MNPLASRREGAVRTARSGDLTPVAALWTGLARQHAEFDASFALRPGSASQVRGWLAGQLREPGVALLVFDRAGEVLGFCCVCIEHAPPIALERVRAQITDLAVREEQRRRGIGGALARAAVQWARARGVARVEVRVASHNRDAQAFWRAQGFGDLVDVLHRRL